MLAIDGEIKVRCGLEEAWDLFCRFGDVAKLIPSVEHVEVDGDRVFGRVGIKLGILFVSSRVALEVVERTDRACLKAVGVSYLGETIQDQVAKKGVRGIDSDSTGRVKIQLDLAPTDDEDFVNLTYAAEVEAEGRLKRIYQSIIKNKAPAMMTEFAENVRNTLEHPSTEDPSVETEAIADSAALVAAPTRGWWRRLVAWFSRLFNRT